MAAHEANVGPWERTAAKVGAKVVWWESDGAAHVTATVDTLRPLLNERTRIVRRGMRARERGRGGSFLLPLMTTDHISLF